MGEALALVDGAPTANVFVDDLFSRSPQDLRFLKRKEQTFLPTNTMLDKASTPTIGFTLPAWNSACMYLLGEMSIQIGIKMTQDNKPLLDDKYIALVNQPLYSVFSDVKIFLNETCVTPYSGNYGMRAYFENTLGASFGHKRTVLESVGYFEDTVGHVDTAGAANLGFMSRMLENCEFDKPDTGLPTSWKFNKGLWKYYGPLISDFSGKPCPIPNGVMIRFEFTLQKNDFVVHSAVPNVEYEVEMMKLYAPYVVLSHNMGLAVEDRLAKESLFIDLRRRSVQTFHMITNTSSTELSNLFPQNKVPCRVIIAVCRRASWEGSYQTSPFNLLRHLGARSTGNLNQLKSVTCTINGDSLDGRPSELLIDFVKLHNMLGFIDTGLTSGITLEMFKQGKF